MGAGDWRGENFPSRSSSFHFFLSLGRFKETIYTYVNGEFLKRMKSYAYQNHFPF